MVKGTLDVGQAVRVDIPKTYGRIAGVTEFQVHIEYMDEVRGLLQGISISGSAYPFHHKTFGKAFHPINPADEISKLETELKEDISPEQRKFLTRAIDYLREFAER